MYCPRCGKPNLSGDVCVPCLTDKEYREIYGANRDDPPITGFIGVHRHLVSAKMAKELDL